MFRGRPLGQNFSTQLTEHTRHSSSVKKPTNSGRSSARVRGACELLGLDPLHIANEGQFLVVVAPEYSDAAINALNLSAGGENACAIGTICMEPLGSVLVTTSYGGRRIVDMLVGDPLPRIC